MFHCFLRLFLCCGLLISASAQANILRDLLAAAMKHDNQLLLAEAQLKEAQARVRGTAGEMGPQISAIIQRNEQDGKCSGDFCEQGPFSGERTGSLNALSLSQPLYEPQLHSAFRRDKARTERQGYLYAAARMDVFQRLLTQYLDIRRETDRLRTLQAQSGTLAKQVERVRGLVSSGVRRRADLTETQAAADLNLAQIEQSKIMLRTFYEGLSESTKLTIRNLPPIRKDFELPALTSQDAEHWKKMALQKNFSLRAARKGMDAARFELRRLTYGPVPKLNLYAEWSENDLELEAGRQEQRQTEIGIRFRLPLYEGGLYSNIQVARAQKAQAEQRLLLAELEVKTLVPSLVRLVLQGKNTVNAALRSMQAKETIAEQTNLRYLSGTASITEALEGYENFYEAERAYYESLYGHITNYADFYVRTGSLDEETIRPFYDIADFTDYNPDQPVYLEDGAAP